MVNLPVTFLTDINSRLTLKAQLGACLFANNQVGINDLLTDVVWHRCLYSCARGVHHYPEFLYTYVVSEIYAEILTSQNT